MARFSIALLQWAALLVSFFILRVALSLAFLPGNAVSLGDLLQGYLIGLHLDTFVALLLTLPLVIWLALIPDRWFAATWHRILLPVCLLIFWGVQTYLFFTEYYFFDEFKSRFNTVAVDYLMYHHEVFVNIWEDYPIIRIILVSVVYASIIVTLGRKAMRRGYGIATTGSGRWAAAGVWGLATVGLGLTVGIREARFCQERLLNELANNGHVSFYAAFTTSHLDYAAFYRTMPPAEAFTRSSRLLSHTNVTFVNSTTSLQRRVAGDTNRPKMNVVILLEESLGSEFWGCLGAKKKNPLTPEMDKLAAECGMLFTNIYASGNRTVRGFEGVFSSFPPLPGDSIVKRDHSKNVETIARVLQRDGYSTVFLYGGRGFFDNMRAFAVNNGYERFIEEKHFPNPTFTTMWGVCDEDLMQRTIEECRALNDTGKPFLATALTVSNHRPFRYPKGRIPEDPEKKFRDYAVKYADYSLGQFFKAARQEKFWTNTIFVVVADHGARVYGKQSIPMHSYEIPLLVVAPGLATQPQRIGALGCSLDVSPTILGMIGRPYDTLFFGRDLLKNSTDGMVWINHNRDIGLYHREHLVVFGLNKTVEFYHGNPRTDTLQRVFNPDTQDLELEQDAMAIYQSADDLYVNEHYRVQPPTALSTAELRDIGQRR